VGAAESGTSPAIVSHWLQPPAIPVPRNRPAIPSSDVAIQDVMTVFWHDPWVGMSGRLF